MFKKEKNKVAQGGYGGYVNLSEKNIQFYKETTEIDPLKNFEVALSDGEKVDIETLVTSLSQKTDEKGLKKELEGKNSAQKALLRTAYDLGSSIQEFLAEHTKNEATWEKIMDDLVFYSQEIAGELVTKVKNIGKKEDQGKDKKIPNNKGSFMVKVSHWGVPLVSPFVQKRVKKKVESTILVILPDLLTQQLLLTKKALDRVKAKKILVKSMQNEAFSYYQELAKTITTKASEIEPKRKKHEARKREYKKVSEQLKKMTNLEDLEEYAQFVEKNTKLFDEVQEMEEEVDKVTNLFNAAKEGYQLTEVQISQFTDTLRGLGKIINQLESYYTIMKPILERSIHLLGVHNDGMKAAQFMAQLGKGANSSLKICSYMTACITQEAIDVSQVESVDPETMAEVKEIHKINQLALDQLSEFEYNKAIGVVKNLENNKFLGNGVIAENILNEGKESKQLDSTEKV